MDRGGKAVRAKRLGGFRDRGRLSRSRFVGMQYITWKLILRTTSLSKVICFPESGSSGVSSLAGRKFAYVTKALTVAGSWTDMFSLSGVFIGVISEVFGQCNVYGSITKSHNFKNKKINLASLLDGASVVACNNEHFGKAENILAPGKAKNMGDGWETRRRRNKARRRKNLCTKS